MQCVIPDQANTVYATVIARADHSPITTGDVYFYLRCTAGDQAGKYWIASTSAWSSTKGSAGTATHVDDGLYSLSIAAGAWPDYESEWRLSWEESGDLHKPESDQVIPRASGVLSLVSYGAYETEIANMALAMLGGATDASQSAISDISDGGNPTAVWCERLFRTATEHALLDLRPPEAVKYDEITALSSYDDFPGNEDAELYVYNIPSDCVAIIAVVDRDLRTSDNGIDPEETEYWYNEAGDQFVTDQEAADVYLKYVRRIGDASKFSHGLKLVIAGYLAFLLAGAMGKTKFRLELLKLYDFQLGQARRYTGQRKRKRITPQPWIDIAASGDAKPTVELP